MKPNLSNAARKLNKKCNREAKDRGASGRKWYVAYACVDLKKIDQRWDISCEWACTYSAGEVVYL